jgi:hypothetical protein
MIRFDHYFLFNYLPLLLHFTEMNYSANKYK